MKKKKIEKRFCEECGLEMIASEYTTGFDRYTGEPRPYVRYTCPTLNWDEMMKNPMFNWSSDRFMGHYYFSEKLY